jgi:hypothetical protein
MIDQVPSGDAPTWISWFLWPWLKGVATAVTLTALPATFLAARAAYDKRRVHQWLRDNTKDEPEKSHVSTIAIAKGTRIPEERVHRACMSDRRILRSKAGPSSDEAWSVWRSEPERAYQMFVLSNGRR